MKISANILKINNTFFEKINFSVKITLSFLETKKIFFIFVHLIYLRVDKTSIKY